MYISTHILSTAVSGQHVIMAALQVCLIIVCAMVCHAASFNNVNEKKPCCGPDQLKGSGFTLITYVNNSYSVNTALEFYWKVSMDFRNQWFYYNYGVLHPGALYTYGIYVNFKEKYGFLINLAEEECYPISDLAQWKFLQDRECLPKNATFWSSHQIGTEPKWLHVDYWTYREKIFWREFETVAAVQSDVCVPAIEYRKWIYNNHVVMTRATTYLNIQKGVDPGSAQPPKYCKRSRFGLFFKDATRAKEGLDLARQLLQ